MNELKRSRQAWDSRARQDAMWNILTDPTKAGRKWSQDEFFATGCKEISALLDYLRGLGIGVEREAVVLDFGCGIGRLTQALAAQFAAVHGVDISAEMLAVANRLNQSPNNCIYHLNDRPDLALFPNETFDLIYSSIVLQHVPVGLVEGYLTEFIRVLKPHGVLVFQMPERFRGPADRSLAARYRAKLNLRARLSRLFDRVIPDPHFVHMNALPEQQIRRVIAATEGTVKDVRITNSTEAHFDGDLRFLEREPDRGWVSKQYCVTRVL